MSEHVLAVALVAVTVSDGARDAAREVLLFARELVRPWLRLIGLGGGR